MKVQDLLLYFRSAWTLVASYIEYFVFLIFFYWEKYLLYFIRLIVKGNTVLYRTFQLMYLYPVTDDCRNEMPKFVVGE